MLKRVLIPCLATSLSLATLATSYCCSVQAEEIVVDTVLASVDGKPITLHDLEKRLKNKRRLTLSQASSDPEVRYALDLLILERLILEEAESRKMSVSDNEIAAYIDEVAKQNGMNRSDFEKALGKESRTPEEYKAQVRVEILKSRLASTYLLGGVGISDEEIDKYISESQGGSLDHPKPKNKVKLRQLFVNKSGRSSEEFANRVAEIVAKVKDGSNFPDLVAKYSDVSDKAEGGSLGDIAESDLSPKIFDAILSLKEGQVSTPVEADDGARFFLLEARIAPEIEDKQVAASASKELREEAKRALQRRKLETKMQNFFSTELVKLHTVDRKI